MAAHERRGFEPSPHPPSTLTLDGAGHATARLQVENQQLRIELTQALQAMAAREVIEQAKGLLMGHYRCPPEAAFEVLRAASQHTNVKLRDLALAVTERASREGRVGYPGLDEAATVVLGERPTSPPRERPGKRPSPAPTGWR